MKKSLLDFRDDEEREVFFVAIPVILLFGLLGYWYLFGKTTEPVSVAVTAEDTISDIDADNVPDYLDHCINRAGTVANLGCPGTIRSNQTNSAVNATANATAGVSSAAIPLVATATKVNDDRDGDQVRDADDRCPSVSGEASDGCPKDSDNDGITDKDDSCAQLAGTVENSGCPQDADGDGVLGEADSCPEQPGTAIDNGCPKDSDNDGVLDTEDNCPTTAGPNNGCPDDDDNDGVVNPQDKCPDQPGTSANHGCPLDADGDGVLDADDRCPQTAGSLINDGCAKEAITDIDLDGVSDDLDQCPDEAGLSDNNGCPASARDSDADGVIDTNDECPTIAGDADANGCPPVADTDRKIADADADGIADKDDKCPTVAGTAGANGCVAENTSAMLSQEDQDILDKALSQVAFNSNSATLTAQSQAILRDVAGLLRKYPDANLEIRGHTDSSGPASRNMQLSMLRAKSCATYIAQLGTDITRLIAYGYGESKPVASNASAAGRKSNRRVEFELKFGR